MSERIADMTEIIKLILRHNQETNVLITKLVGVKRLLPKDKEEEDEEEEKNEAMVVVVEEEEEKVSGGGEDPPTQILETQESDTPKDSEHPSVSSSRKKDDLAKPRVRDTPGNRDTLTNLWFRIHGDLVHLELINVRGFLYYKCLWCSDKPRPAMGPYGTLGHAGSESHLEKSGASKTLVEELKKTEITSSTKSRTFTKRPSKPRRVTLMI
jgi:hypothetical protein